MQQLRVGGAGGGEREREREIMCVGERGAGGRWGHLSRTPLFVTKTSIPRMGAEVKEWERLLCFLLKSQMGGLATWVNNLATALLCG